MISTLYSAFTNACMCDCIYLKSTSCVMYYKMCTSEQRFWLYMQHGAMFSLLKRVFVPHMQTQRLIFIEHRTYCAPAKSLHYIYFIYTNHCDKLSFNFDEIILESAPLAAYTEWLGTSHAYDTVSKVHSDFRSVYRPDYNYAPHVLYFKNYSTVLLGTGLQLFSSEYLLHKILVLHIKQPTYQGSGLVILPASLFQPPTFAWH